MGPPICIGRGYPIFQKCIFKLHPLLRMWSVLAEFCCGSSEGSVQKKKEERIAVTTVDTFHHSTITVYNEQTWLQGKQVKLLTEIRCHVCVLRETAAI